MINEEFDDDIPDETEAEILAAFDEGSKGVTERPVGQFKRVLHGRPIWFKQPIPGQFTVFRRYRETLGKRADLLAAKARKDKTVEALNGLQEMAERIDLTTLEFFESMLADDGDSDFIAMEMISGRVTMRDIHDLMFGSEDEVDDDQAPPVKPKTPRKQTASKAAANAKRTRK